MVKPETAKLIGETNVTQEDILKLSLPSSTITTFRSGYKMQVITRTMQGKFGMAIAYTITITLGSKGLPIRISLLTPANTTTSTLR